MNGFTRPPTISKIKKEQKSKKIKRKGRKNYSDISEQERISILQENKG